MRAAQIHHLDGQVFRRTRKKRVSPSAPPSSGSCEPIHLLPTSLLAMLALSTAVSVLSSMTSSRCCIPALSDGSPTNKRQPVFGPASLEGKIGKALPCGSELLLVASSAAAFCVQEGSQKQLLQRGRKRRVCVWGSNYSLKERYLSPKTGLLSIDNLAQKISSCCNL